MNNKIDLVERRRMREEMLASDPERRKIYERSIAISKPVMDELVQIVYEIENLDELKYIGKPWKSARLFS